MQGIGIASNLVLVCVGDIFELVVATGVVFLALDYLDFYFMMVQSEQTRDPLY